ncbi:hypothetical protein BaRGS_00031818 [Batillaria attramentaria]|uniref:tRNA-binding domain-containing protein n=1 Tax=Batillaria attramentaria TaxID=370345 RepID=A0ABD0JPN2_9CAEN
MATAAVLKTLRARADQADTILATLRHQISALQTATALTAGRGEEQRLRTENEALRKEIEKARLSLMVAEIRNGEQPQSKPAAAQPQAKKAKKETGPPKEENKAAKEGKEESKGKGKKAAEAGSEEPEKMDVSRLDFRIGKIVAVEKHPDADTLYVETVDLGEEKTRTIVSGLVPHIPIEQMRDRLAVFMCNLKPSKMRGIASEGMIMCANAGKVEILVPPPGVVPGDCISFDGYSGTPDKQLNPKKKIWETLKPDIRTNSERVATYKGVPFKVEGKGIVKAPTLADAQIS